jgi:hypothetical protein
MALSNPRAVVGDNQPPSAIEHAAEPVENLRVFLADNPVITGADEARDAKAHLDRVVLALKDIEEERKSKVDPLNAEVKAVNAAYHKWHNADAKRPGLWDKLLGELRSRLTSFAKLEERKRYEQEQAARHAAEQAAENARRAAEAEAAAREEVASGVCDVDLGGAIEEAQQAEQAAIRADWNARRAEAETKVRITGGFSNAISLRERETLRITDAHAALEDIGLTQDIADAILKGARAYRKANGELPNGVDADFERSL